MNLNCRPLNTTINETERSFELGLDLGSLEEFFAFDIKLSKNRSFRIHCLAPSHKPDAKQKV
jgi:hypothetical protein